MKAIKLTKIHWNLNGFSKEEAKKILNTLPTEKGFTVDDDFNVVERVPRLLKKKYGYEIIEFAFTENRIAETVEELLDICRKDTASKKDLFSSNGNLTTEGKKAKENLESLVESRIRMEKRGTLAHQMPKILDEVVLGLEKITGLDWETSTADEMLAPVYRKIWDMKATNLKDKFEDYDDE